MSASPPSPTSKSDEILVDLAEDIEVIHVSMLQDLECLDVSPRSTQTQTDPDLEESPIPIPTTITSKQTSSEIDTNPITSTTSKHLTKPIPPPSLLLEPLWASIKHWSIQPFTVLTISNGLLIAIVAGISIWRQRPAAALPRIQDIGIGYAMREVVDRIAELEGSIDLLHVAVEGLAKRKGWFW